jgi:16S rRNA G966 N2-methylase RsmD
MNNLIFFPNYNEVNFNNLKIDTIGEYSITRPPDAKQISEIIKSETNDSCILDTTAGSGGNTLSFAKYFDTVISVESNFDRYCILKNNINEYGFKNILTYYNDCLNIIERKYSKIIFFDPPWGGKSYTKQDKIDLLLSGFKIYMIIRYIFIEFPDNTIFIKIPVNFDYDQLEADVNIENLKFKLFTINKFYLLKICF